MRAVFVYENAFFALFTRKFGLNHSFALPPFAIFKWIKIESHTLGELEHAIISFKTISYRIADYYCCIAYYYC